MKKHSMKWQWTQSQSVPITRHTITPWGIPSLANIDYIGMLKHWDWAFSIEYNWLIEWYKDNNSNTIPTSTWNILSSLLPIILFVFYQRAATPFKHISKQCIILQARTMLELLNVCPWPATMIQINILTRKKTLKKLIISTIIWTISLIKHLKLR